MDDEKENDRRKIQSYAHQLGRSIWEKKPELERSVCRYRMNRYGVKWRMNSYEVKW